MAGSGRAKRQWSAARRKAAKSDQAHRVAGDAASDTGPGWIASARSAASAAAGAVWSHMPSMSVVLRGSTAEAGASAAPQDSGAPATGVAAVDHAPYHNLRAVRKADTSTSAATVAAELAAGARAPAPTFVFPPADARDDHDAAPTGSVSASSEGGYGLAAAVLGADTVLASSSATAPRGASGVSAAVGDAGFTEGLEDILAGPSAARAGGSGSFTSSTAAPVPAAPVAPAAAAQAQAAAPASSAAGTHAATAGGSGSPAVPLTVKLPKVIATFMHAGEIYVLHGQADVAGATTLTFPNIAYDASDEPANVAQARSAIANPLGLNGELVDHNRPTYPVKHSGADYYVIDMGDKDATELAALDARIASSADNSFGFQRTKVADSADPAVQALGKFAAGQKRRLDKPAIVKTQGHNNNCLLESMLTWLVVQSQHGDTETRAYINDPGRFTALFAQLHANGHTALTDFASLAALPVADFQKQGGDALRAILAKLLITDAKAKAYHQNLLRPYLLSEFDQHPRVTPDPVSDLFNGMPFVAAEFAKLKAQGGTDADQERDLLAWWDSTGHTQYFQHILMPGNELGGPAAQILADHFGFNVLHAMPSTQGRLGGGTDARLDRPTITLRHTGVNHWEAYLENDLVDYHDAAAGTDAGKKLNATPDAIAAAEAAASPHVDAGAAAAAAASTPGVVPSGISADDWNQYLADQERALKYYRAMRDGQKDAWVSKLEEPSSGQAPVLVTHVPDGAGHQDTVKLTRTVETVPGAPAAAGTSSTVSSQGLRFEAEYEEPTTTDYTRLNQQQQKARAAKAELLAILKAYHTEFTQAGMDPVIAAIDLTQMGSTWVDATSGDLLDEAMVKDCCKQAGFKRALYQGKELYNDIKPAPAASATGASSAVNPSAVFAAPAVSASAASSSASSRPAWTGPGSRSAAPPAAALTPAARAAAMQGAMAAANSANPFTHPGENAGFWAQVGMLGLAAAYTAGPSVVAAASSALGMG